MQNNKIENLPPPQVQLVIASIHETRRREEFREFSAAKFIWKIDYQELE